MTRGVAIKLQLRDLFWFLLVVSVLCAAEIRNNQLAAGAAHEPGFWAISLEFKSEVDISSPIMINSRETVEGYVKLHSQVASGKSWLNTINKGLEELIANIKKKIKSP